MDKLGADFWAVADSKVTPESSSRSRSPSVSVPGSMSQMTRSEDNILVVPRVVPIGTGVGPPDISIPAPSAGSSSGAKTSRPTSKSSDNVGSEVDMPCPICKATNIVGGMHCSACQRKTCNQCTIPTQADIGDGRGKKLRLMCSDCLEKYKPVDPKSLPFLTVNGSPGASGEKQRSPKGPLSPKISRKKAGSNRNTSFPGIQVREVKECPNCREQSSDYSECFVCKRDTCFKCTELTKVPGTSKLRGRKEHMMCSSCSSSMKDRLSHPKKKVSRRLSKSNIKSNSVDYWTASLQDIVAFQRRRTTSNIQRELWHPLMLAYLLDLVRELDGFSKKGIFRLSVAGSQVLAAQKHINGAPLGPWSLPTQDAHLPAALIKRWLRDLPTPLLNDYPLLMECVDSGRDAALYRSVLEALSQSHRATLVLLFKFLHDLAQPEVSEITKMTVDNVAIVFSQCIMRNPSNNPQEMLRNQPKEQQFVIELMEMVAEKKINLDDLL